MDAKQIKEAAIEIISKAEFAVLSSIDDNGYPVSRAMLNLKEGGINALFSTNTSSKKVNQIQKNKKGSVFFTANQEWKGLTIIGDLEIISDKNVKKDLWKSDWTMYYPGGLEDPDYTVIKINAKKISLYYAMQKATLEL